MMTAISIWGARWAFLMTVPMALPAVLYLGAAIRAGLNNPRVTVWAGNTRLAPGDMLEFGWALEGGRRDPSSFQLLLRGEETYTDHGAETATTLTSVFFERPLLDTGTAVRGASGRISAMIPPDAMHSFTSRISGIAWKLVGRVVASGESTFEFPLVIEPELHRGDEANAAKRGPKTRLPRLSTEMSGTGVHLYQRRFRPGDLVEGYVDLGTDSARPSRHGLIGATVRLRWVARNYDTEEGDIVAEQVLNRASGGGVPFALRLPDRPHSFAGQHLSVIWVVEAEELLSRVIITVSPP